MISVKKLLSNSAFLLLFVAGVLLSVYYAVRFAQLDYIYRLILEVHPIGRMASFVAIPLLVLAGVLKTRRANDQPIKVANPYIVFGVLFISVWLSFLPALGSWVSVDNVARPIGGIVPLADSKAYYEGSQQLIQKGEFGTYNQRRPLNATMLSSRWLLAKQDYRRALLLQDAMFGAAVGFLAVVVWMLYGGLAAGLVYSLLFAFAAHYLPTALSEELGITLGVLSLTFFLLSLGTGKQRFYHTGLFLFTLALLARTGTVLVIPLLVVFAGWHFAREGKFSFKQACIGAGAVVAAFLFSYLLNITYGDGSPGIQGNSHFILYDLSVAGDGWQQVYEDYPELVGAPRGDVASFTLAKTFEAIKAHPSTIFVEYSRRLITDSIGAAKELFHHYAFASYSLKVSEFLQDVTPLKSNSAETVKTYIVVFTALLLLVYLVFGGLRALACVKGSRLVQISLLVLVGTIFSVPVLFSVGGIRVFAVTIPYLALIPMIASLAIRRREVLLQNNSGMDAGSIPWHLYAFLILILGLALVVPYIAHKQLALDIHTKRFVEFDCGDDGKKLLVKMGSGAPHISIVADDAVEKSFAPIVRISDYRISPMHKHHKESWDQLMRLGPGRTLYVAYDVLGNRVRYLVFNTSLLEDKPIAKKLCAKRLGETKFWEVTSVVP